MDCEASKHAADPLAGTAVFGLLKVFNHEEYLARFFEEFPEDHPVYPIALAYKEFHVGNYERALQVANEINTEELASSGVLYPLIARSAIMIRQYDDAARYLALDSPILASDVTTPVTRFNANPAVLLAFVEQQRGNERVAATLLQQVLAVADSVPRVGYSGHGILDVRALTLQGRTAAALELLREQPGYAEVRNEMRARVEVMEERLKNATQTGNRSELLSLANRDLQAANR